MWVVVSAAVRGWDLLCQKEPQCRGSIALGKGRIALGRGSNAQKCKKAKCDGPTDRRTDGRTDRHGDL